MRAAHAVFTILTGLFLAGALPLTPTEAVPSPFAKNASPVAAKPGKELSRSRTTVRRTSAGQAARTATAARQSIGPRPGRWCGWWMRTQLGGGPEYNLARNWVNRGRPLNGPRVGAVVVWSHHVGLITGRTKDGQWIVKSGNDGGQVRERPRNVSGAVFRMV
jgi:hypothetical protein